MIALLIIFLGHWIMDFIVQTRWQAENKSKRIDALLGHVVIYSWGMTLFYIIYHYYSHFYGADLTNHTPFSLQATVLFLTITFTAHFITDYITSRITARLYKENKIHEFWGVIGFDQLLHTIQLVLTIQYLAA